MFLYFLASLVLCAHGNVNCSAKGNAFSKECRTVVDESGGWSGGYCLASMSSAGWMRSSAINPIVASTSHLAYHDTMFPLVTGSSSGGSMFASRFFLLSKRSSNSNWNYPCYLMSEPYKSVCFFHGAFGTISMACQSEKLDVVSTAASLVYGGVVAQYGGPFGVAALFLGVYFPFLADLPLSKGSTWGIVPTTLPWNTRFRGPVVWVVAHTVSNPIAARQDPHNFGCDSWLSRGVHSGSSPANNVSLVWINSASANVQSGAVMAPFSFSGKSWDDRAGVSQQATTMKLFGLTLSFVLISNLMRAHTILNTVDGQDGCVSGCPVLDGGFSDNSPLTPVVSLCARSNPRPPWMMSVGAASTMVTVKYLLGSGPLSIWTLGSINVCPFIDEGMCMLLSGLRKSVVRALPSTSRNEYEDMTSAYGMFRPEVALIAPYCGDPLAYDLFESRCTADSVCDMWTTVLPSMMNAVKYTTEVYVLVFVMAYLQRSQVSKRFVQNMIPFSVLNIPYYQDMQLWFPDFDAVAKSKGGIGFTSLAGNMFMDYMTYLAIRLVGYLMKTKKDAKKLMMGVQPRCNFHLYELAASKTIPRTARGRN